jgi:phosphoribosylformylglycinamidine cyclo-ligase
MSETTKEPQTYGQLVNYADMDPFKVAAQKAATTTAHNLEDWGYEEVVASRGESAYVWKEGDKYRAMVTEGLGTKNLVADAVSELGEESYYEKVAQDTIAMIVNDLLVVKAEPQVVTAHFSVGDSRWFNDPKHPRRQQDLIDGWAGSCELAHATWGGGETPTLKGIVEPGKIELSGTALGEIRHGALPVLGDRLEAGDDIILLGSTGIHANGLTLAREIADNLPEGYKTLLSDGTPYGEALLEPTPIYVDPLKLLFEAGVDIHYMANITGHGWRKIMRANVQLTYILDNIPKPQPIFDIIQEKSGNDNIEMYGNFNMGAGFAIFTAQQDTERALDLLHEEGHDAMYGGSAMEGEKRVYIPAKGVLFEEDSLQVR